MLWYYHSKNKRATLVYYHVFFVIINIFSMSGFLPARSFAAYVPVPEQQYRSKLVQRTRHPTFDQMYAFWCDMSNPKLRLSVSVWKVIVLWYPLSNMAKQRTIHRIYIFIYILYYFLCFQMWSHDFVFSSDALGLIDIALADLPRDQVLWES